jgi:hypothetical protein
MMIVRVDRIADLTCHGNRSPRMRIRGLHTNGIHIYIRTMPLSKKIIYDVSKYGIELFERMLRELLSPYGSFCFSKCNFL